MSKSIGFTFAYSYAYHTQLDILLALLNDGWTANTDGLFRYQPVGVTDFSEWILDEPYQSVERVKTIVNQKVTAREVPVIEILHSVTGVRFTAFFHQGELGLTPYNDADESHVLLAETNWTDASWYFQLVLQAFRKADIYIGALTFKEYD